MPKKQTKTTSHTPTPVVQAPVVHSSESENSDIEDRAHSRTSTSSVEDEQVKQNGHPRTNNAHKENSVSFLTRVSSIPLIQDSVSTLHSYAKDNKYGRYALDTAGSAVETVNKYTEDYQTRLQPHLQPHIAKVDQLASKSLDILEGTFPIVTKPTSEIVKEVKKPYVFVEESSKNAYTQIQSTIDTRVTAPVKSVASTVVSTAAQTRDQITSTAVQTRDQITTVATSTATNIASKVNTHATPLVNGLETIVNRVLPADASVEDEQTAAGQTNQATRVVDIGRSVTRRVTRRVGTAVAPVTKSAQELRAAAEKNAVVVKSKDQIIALNVRLTALLDAIRVHAKELQENVQKVPSGASSRISELSNRVLLEFDNLSVYLKVHGPTLPDYVQVRIQPLMTFVNDRYAVVKSEFAKKDISAIQKARNILHLTTEETLPILQNAAQEIQVKVQEGIQKGLDKAHDINSSVHLSVSQTYQAVHVIIVGK
ncbi:hypothetical protein EDD21DRAFT_393599 [Dissophora ornata]|nr:hypothetical protein BGZ58_002931 [Dissophora ornata]KAI8594454.1 hypothetical protein EDD21DRAFT_393599 [Dissophora ornata]